MHRYIVKRLLLAIPTLVGAAALVFVLMRLIPGDVCVVRLGAGGTHVDPAAVAAPIDYVVSSGRGTVFSFVVHHAPKVPGRTLPFVIALVELEEGVRMLGELRNADHAKVKIGMPVQTTYIDFPAGDNGPGWSHYAWEPQA